MEEALQQLAEVVDEVFPFRGEVEGEDSVAVRL
jgi:hypothetical protein